MNARFVQQTLLLAACLTLATAPAWGYGPVDPQFQVNSYTTNYQGSARVGMVANGDFVVVWRSLGSEGSDTFYYSVQGQRYAADATPLGIEFQVNSYTTNTQRLPDVGMAADSSFVVVWDSFGSDGSDTSDNSIQAQRYASNGTPLGIQFQVNSYTTSYQDNAKVSVAADDSFVVVWQSNYDVHGQRFASDGTSLGLQFRVNSYISGIQWDPNVGVATDGSFVVVWQSGGSYGNDTSSDSVQGQRFAADATPLGLEFQVNSYTTDYQTHPDVGVYTDGDFVVVWASSGSDASDTSSDSVQGQRFAADGTPLGIQFQVNSYTTNDQHYAKVGVAADGSFVVVWQSFGSEGDTSSWSVQGQRFAADATPRGIQFQVNSYTTNLQGQADVGVAAEGSFVVAWRSGGSYGSDTSSDSIQGQRYDPRIFVDGFESGDTSAWSATLP